VIAIARRQFKPPEEGRRAEHQGDLLTPTSSPTFEDGTLDARPRTIDGTPGDVETDGCLGKSAGGGPLTSGAPSRHCPAALELLKTGRIGPSCAKPGEPVPCPTFTLHLRNGRIFVGIVRSVEDSKSRAARCWWIPHRQAAARGKDRVYISIGKSRRSPTTDFGACRTSRDGADIAQFRRKSGPSGNGIARQDSEWRRGRE